MMARKRSLSNLKELGQTVVDIMGMRYEAMENAFGNIEEPMMRAYKVGAQPMIDDIRMFMDKHRRSGRTMASFNPGTLEFDGDMYYFKFGFDMRKGGFPALILEYGDGGSPMRRPNTAYFFIHFAYKNHDKEVFQLMQEEIKRMLAGAKA